MGKYKMYKGRKGSEKPIEIFVALFVILAVAMVLLKMFGGQITAKEKELQEMAEKKELEQKKKDIKNYCDSKCAELDTQMDKVTYCKTKYPGGADLNDNGMKDEYNSQFSIVGVCEDTIYCSAVTECSSLTMGNCAKIMCDYFQERWDMSDSNATERLNDFIEPGKCDMNEEEKSNHWYYMIEDKFNCSQY